MKFAEDFRRIARESLTGKWLIAVAVGMVAVLLGAIGSGGPQVKINIDASNPDVSLNYMGQTLLSIGNGLITDIAAFVAGAAFYIVIITFTMAVVSFVIGSFVGVGYAKFNLNLVDRKEANFDSLFSYFSRWKTTAATRFLTGLYSFLWSLLFVIPGIVAEYSYAMTDYILAEHPNLTATEAIELSKSMMYGNRWRLFCLQLSFIGWDILAVLTFGIGNLWLTPYRQAAYAAFYREVSGNRVVS